MTLIELANQENPENVAEDIIRALERKQKNEEMMDELRELMGLPTSVQIAEMQNRRS